MILLPLIPIIVLVAQTCYQVSQIIHFQTEVWSLQKQVDSAVEMGTILTALQRERGEVAYFIFSNGTRMTNKSESGLTFLEDTYQSTNVAIEQVGIWPRFTTEEASVDLGSKLRFQIRLGNLR